MMPLTPPSPGVTRSQFLARVRASLEHADTQPPASPPPAVDESIARLARPGQDLVDLFTKRAALVGMKVNRVLAGDLVKAIGALLEAQGVKRIVVSVGTVPQALRMKESLRKRGFEIVDWAATPGLESQFDCHAGITDVHAAFAETGTIVCNSGAGHSRGLSLVPPIHVAVVRRSDILPDMLDYWARLKATPAAELPSAMVFITGPSKTADIEGVLVTGVHGPGQVHLMVVEDA